MKICTIIGCNNKHYGKGYCKSHYSQIIKPDTQRNKTFEGRIKRMYSNAKTRVKDKNREHINEICTFEEFRDVVMNSNYHTIFKLWQESDFNSNLMPTTDRIDNTKGYSKDNIQIITRRENIIKGNIETKSNKSHKPSNQKKVKIQNETEEYIFNSGKEACDFLKIPRNYISLAIKNNKPINGYRCFYI